MPRFTSSAQRLLDALRSGWAAPRPRVGGRRPVALTGRRFDSAAAGPDPARAELVIGMVDDPELAMRLISVRGRLHATTLDALSEALDDVDDGAALHLDLTDTEFADRSVLARLEREMDTLEARRVRLRVVGVESLPAYPCD